jgi:hypothetical protein
MFQLTLSYRLRAAHIAHGLQRLIVPCLVMLGSGSVVHAQAPEAVAKLRQAVAFHAAFDGTADAWARQGDGRALTAPSLDRTEFKPGLPGPHVSVARGAGKYGDCLRFTDRADAVLCYSGSVIPYRQSDWSGSVSCWMRLSPDEDLRPGYCDPIQITQAGWNDGALFIDFDKDLPRDFRLGVFSDYKFWNPADIAWEALPVEQRPMVVVKRPRMSREHWTHVLFTFEHFNVPAGSAVKSQATLYLDGEVQGTLHTPQRFTWDVEKAAIMLGIEYIGDMDELILFDRSLTAAEARLLAGLQEPLGH